MAVKNTAQVVIGGKILTLGGYESEEYFQKVASYINNKIAELSEMPGYTRQPVETKHTLLSLNVTDDYFKAKKQAEILYGIYLLTTVYASIKSTPARQTLTSRFLIYISRLVIFGNTEVTIGKQIGQTRYLL